MATTHTTTDHATTNTHTTSTDPTSTSFSDALNRARPALLALPDEQLRPVNLDLSAAVVTVIGALPALRALRSEVVNVLGEPFAEPFDTLELYTQAAGQAHADYLSTSTPSGLQALSDELVAARDVLFIDATSLVKRKVLEGGELAELRGNVGFRNQVFDVLQLVGVFRRHWARVEALTPVKLADLDQAEALAKRLIEALGERERGPAVTTERAGLRTRGYTKFVTTYDEVRRIVTFLRWHQGDVDAIAPSLWAGRGGRRFDEAVTPAAASPSAASPGAATPTEVAAPPPAHAAPPSVPIAPGLPGASPFVTR